MDAPAQERYAEFVAVVRRLLAPGGCPWDREQTPASLRQYVEEEAGEVVAAIDRLLAVEERIRAHRGLPTSNPQPPEGFSTQHEKKGRAHAHHPAREDFSQEASASGAPLGTGDLPPELENARAAALEELRLELGDLLLQPVLLGALAEAIGYFSLDDIVDGITEKLIRRHPHVFGEVKAESAEEVLTNWEAIKRGEKHE
jgi:NTP pyrophosphatase (non-canonical NTP hydrolase)